MFKSKYFELGDIISVYDKEFESSIAFDKSLSSLKGAYNESPEYFTDEILISIYHYVITNEQLDGKEIVEDVEIEMLLGNGMYNTEHLIGLINKNINWFNYDYVWVDFALDEHIESLSKYIIYELQEISNQEA